MSSDPLFFHRLLPILVSPLGAALILLLVGVRRARRWPIVAAAGVIWLFSAPATGDLLLWTLEGRYPPVAAASCPQADAVFVLGGMLRFPDSPIAPLDWNDAVNRFEKGIELVDAGRARYLVLSGAKFTDSPAVPSEGELLRQVAIRRGVPADSIVVTERVINTATEAQSAAKLVRERGWRRILLVTSAYHLPRAAMLFRRCAADVVPIPSDFHVVGGGLRQLSLTGFLPQGEGLFETDTAMHEYLGMCFYSVRRWFGGQ